MATARIETAGAEGKTVETVTVELPVELMERARKSRKRMNELMHRGKNYWGEAGDLEVIHLEILAIVYGD